MTRPVQSLKILPQEAIRKHWPNEARDFTPWLVEHIDLLSDAVGLGLEVEEREAPVGALSADILCRDRITGERIVVENQIEESNHGHLGQVVSYLSVLGVKTAIWVAPFFRPEHLSAVKWLNENLSPDYSFYAVSFGLYKIGESEPAIGFNLLASPSIIRQPKTLNDLNLAQADFWAGFRDYIDGLPQRPFRINKPSPRGYINIPMGSKAFHILASVNSKAKRVSVELWIEGEMAKPYFDRIYDMGYERSKTELSSSVRWRRLDNRKASIISVSTEADFLDMDSRQSIYSWIATEVCLFRKFFLPMINSLSA